ncbi:MAG TPA: EF-hand domain-containing protein [Stenotrophobium sp.]|jgi:hypothetical protein|nr:EF-hand domain-containing protein [Stenotrophobium sp.]
MPAMPRKPFVLLALLSTLFSIPVAAQQQGVVENRLQLMQQRRQRLHDKWEQRFRAADTDHSRTLSRAECVKAGLPASIIDNFDRIDANHDGQLSPEELIAVYEKRLQAQRSEPVAAGTPSAMDKSP